MIQSEEDAVLWSKLVIMIVVGEFLKLTREML
jgi:hypothetical protein